MSQDADAARDFARAVAGDLCERLGERVLGVYLIGSLAHGGFSARYSDIDMALITVKGITQDEIDGTKEHARARSSALGPKLSLFWTDRGFAMGRFPPLDRADYLDHAFPLYERARILPCRPSLAEIRLYLRQQALDSWRRQIDRVTGLAALDAATRKPYLRALLYPARFLYSWHTGRMASNDDAVAFLHKRAQAGLDLDLIDRALACRHADADPDVLFAERDRLGC